MKFQDKCKKIRDILKPLNLPVSHYRNLEEDRYVVWEEDGQSDEIWGDNRSSEQVVSGTADLFTKLEYDEAVDDIQDALNSGCDAWRLLSVQFEEDTGFIHYEWEWSVIG
jgi:hypothetical protein